MWAMNNFLAPNSHEALAKLRGELRLGLPISTPHGTIIAIEHLSLERFQALRVAGIKMNVILSRTRALDLKLSHDPSSDVILKMPSDYPFEKILALADPSMDLDYPGKGPLAQGDIDRDVLAKLLKFTRSSRTLPALIHFDAQLDSASRLDLDIDTDSHAPALRKVSQARVPLKIVGDTTLQVYRSHDIDEEHYAVLIGDQNAKQPLVRVHSACFTGDCLGSLKCDCGPQLHLALETLKSEGGILLYLSQEGRGIGMANKMRAYKLQDQGFDTVQANHKLGFADDERDFRVAADILRALNVHEIRLLTNNPRKIDKLTKAGITVAARVPLQIEAGIENKSYLETKSKKSGHML